MTRKEIAARLHEKKYNCAQSVLCAFAEKTGISEQELFKISEGFGAGMGSTNHVCGALSGAIMLAGIVNSDGNTENPQTKAATYKLATDMTELFNKRAGAVNCRDIKGLDTGIPTCSCGDCISYAVEIAEEILKI